MDIILKTDLLFTAVDEKVREGFVAIKGNKIAKVGALEEASAYIEEGTRVYDLTGQVIAPGFVDNHVFFTGYMWKSLRDGTSGAELGEELLEKIQEVADDVLAEECFKLFEKILRNKEYSRNQYMEFQKLLASRGITSIKEIGFDRYSGFADVLKNMEDEGELKHRVNLVSQPVAENADFAYGEECR